MDTSLQTEWDVDQVVADWGAYYLDHGQNMKNLKTLPFESFDTRDAFTIVPTNETILRNGIVEFDSVLQQYQDAFTPNGKVSVDPVEIHLRQMKIDTSKNPNFLVQTWLGFLTSNKLDRADWPIIRWFIEEYLLKQSMEDMEMQAIYKGVHEAPVEGTPGDPSKVMDGVEKVLNNLITASKITPITVGAISATPATFVGQVEGFVKSIPEKFRYMKMELNMSRTMRDNFIEGMQAKYNMNYSQVNGLLAVRNFENITVAGRPSMMGKDRMWCTPKVNALLGLKGFENSKAFKVESNRRMVDIFSDWHAGVGFIDHRIVYTSDGDL